MASDISLVRSVMCSLYTQVKFPALVSKGLAHFYWLHRHPQQPLMSVFTLCYSLLESVASVGYISRLHAELVYVYEKIFSEAICVIQHYYKHMRTYVLSSVVCQSSLKCDSGVTDNCTAIYSIKNTVEFFFKQCALLLRSLKCTSSVML